MKYLILGKNGNLGRTFEQLLKQQHAEAICCDIDELDITKREDIINFAHQISPNIIINCAAYTNVDAAETNFELAKLLNADAVENIALAAKNVGAEVIHFSTGMVFDGLNSSGYSEDDLPNPVNAYGRSKLLGEQLLQSSWRKHYIVRTEWLYAKPQNNSGKKSFNEIMIDLSKNNTELSGVSDEIGKPTWAQDLAEAVLANFCANSSDIKPQYGIYHLANEGQASRKEWAEEIFQNLNLNVKVKPVSGLSFERVAQRPNFEILNNTKLAKMRSWKSALKQYLERV